jgi:hypothetical protein
MTATVTEITGGTRYVVHGTEDGQPAIRYVTSSSQSRALLQAGLEGPWGIHNAERSNCDYCRRALAAEAVSQP